MALHPLALPGRLPQPLDGGDAVGLGLSSIRKNRAPDYRQRGRRWPRRAHGVTASVVEESRRVRISASFADVGLGKLETYTPTGCFVSTGILVSQPKRSGAVPCTMPKNSF